MLVTSAVFHLLMSWLKELAPMNISHARHRAVSQLPMSWLKAVALANMSCMVVTELVSQLPMSWLKLLAPWNMLPWSSPSSCPSC